MSVGTVIFTRSLNPPNSETDKKKAFSLPL